MTAPFAIGTKVRLTGEGWHGTQGVPAQGADVTITAAPRGGGDEAGRFTIEGDPDPWYVTHAGYWAAEAVEEPFTLPRSRKDVQDAYDALIADWDHHDTDAWSIGYDKGYASALEWVLKAEPWTVAD